MTGQPYPCIEVQGLAYERGYQHGQQARDRVLRSIEIYRAAFEANNKLAWPAVLERARGFAGSIQAVEPAILEEMRGIADGAGVPLEEIVAINCRTEILYGRASAPPPDSTTHECTTIAVMPAASANGHTLIGKNWDWRTACHDSIVILRAQPDDGPAFVMIVEAGMVGRDGLNAAGIAVCGNLLRSTQDGGQAALPIPLIRRRILNSRRLDDALSAVLKAERSASSNYVIGHASGIIVNLEAAPGNVYPVYPERGLLTHSNHFLALEARVQGIGIDYSADTLYRHYRARALLEPKIGHITIEDIQAVLRDHAGFPKAICRHPDEREPEVNRTSSVASLVIDLTEGVMYIASGPPCSAEYQRVTVPGTYEPATTGTAPLAVGG